MGELRPKTGLQKGTPFCSPVLYASQHFGLVLGKNDLPKIRFHDLRHSCVSLLLANRVSLKEIQEWLGHSTFSTTADLYAHLDESAKSGTANAMMMAGLNTNGN